MKHGSQKSDTLMLSALGGLADANTRTSSSLLTDGQPYELASSGQLQDLRCNRNWFVQGFKRSVVPIVAILEGMRRRSGDMYCIPPPWQRRCRIGETAAGQNVPFPQLADPGEKRTIFLTSYMHNKFKGQAHQQSL